MPPKTEFRGHFDGGGRRCIPVASPRFERQIIGVLGVNRRMHTGQRIPRRRDGGHGFPFDIDDLGRVFSNGPAGRHGHGHGFALPACGIDRHRVLVMHLQRRDMRSTTLPGGADPGEFPAGHHMNDAIKRLGPRRVD